MTSAINRIEQKFDSAMAMLSELAKADNSADRAKIKEKIHGTVDEITGYSRDILKTEWETVKKGEPSYQTTKRWSIGGSIAMLFLLISIGIHAGISIWRSPSQESPPSQQPSTQVAPNS